MAKICNNFGFAGDFNQAYPTYQALLQEQNAAKSKKESKFDKQWSEMNPGVSAKELDTRWEALADALKKADDMMQQRKDKGKLDMYL